MGNLVLTDTHGYNNNATRTLDMGALTYPTGASYLRHKVTIDAQTQSSWYLSWGGGEQSFTNNKWGNWYSDESLLKNSSYPGEAVLKVKNSTGVYSTVTVTLTVEYSNPYTAVTAGNKINKEDINQTGTSITAGTKINASIKSGLTAGNKITASDFNSIVLGL